MIALNSNKLKNAIARAKKLHPRVDYLWWRTYLVTSPRSGNQYLVKFQVTNGQQFGLCTCKAGEVNMPCYHLASAASVQIGVAAMRRAAAQSSAQQSTSSASSTPPQSLDCLPDHEYHSHQDTPFSLPQHSHLCLECQTNEVCTDEHCEQTAATVQRCAWCVLTGARWPLNSTNKPIKAP
jgi:hypothetical protein